MSDPRTALVTGASRGIGQAIADLLRARGYRVVAPSREEMDLSSPASVEEYLRTRGADVDVLVNNAGTNRVAPLAELALDDWQAVLAVNLTSPFLLIQAAAAAMRRRGGGRIVNIGSSYGQVSRAGRAAYSAAKSGLNGLTRTAAIEYGPHHILINTLSPGFVETDMTRQNNSEEQLQAIRDRLPLGRLASPAEIAEFAVYLASEANTYLTGQSIQVDGGLLCQ